MKNERCFLISTRPERKFKETVKRRCFDVLNAPLTRIETISNLDQVLRSMIDFRPDTLILTSRAGSEILLDHADKEFLESVKIFCIGDKTAEPLLEHGLSAAVPEKMNTGGLADLVSSTIPRNSSVAIFRSSHGNPDLILTIRKFAHRIAEFEAYRIAHANPSGFLKLIADRRCKGVIVTSPMEAGILSGLLEKREAGVSKSAVMFFAIGEPSYSEMERLGIPVQKPVGHSDFLALVKDIESLHCKNSGEWI